MRPHPLVLLLAAWLAGCSANRNELGRAGSSSTLSATSAPSAQATSSAAILPTTASSAAPPPAGPSAAASAAPSVEAILQAHRSSLSQAGDHQQCDGAVDRVRAALAADTRVGDEDMQQEIDRYERIKGPMPYPSPGTACAIFGFQRALAGALAERRAKRGH
jgi:hypothetical protein